MAPPREYRTCIVRDTAHRACNLCISGEGSARQGAALVLGEVPEDAVVICVVGRGVNFALGVQANPLILVVAMVVSDNVSCVELCMRITTLGRAPGRVGCLPCKLTNSACRIFVVVVRTDIMILVFGTIHPRVVLRSSFIGRGSFGLQGKTQGVVPPAGPAMLRSAYSTSVDKIIVPAWTRIMTPPGVHSIGCVRDSTNRTGDFHAVIELTTAARETPTIILGKVPLDALVVAIVALGMSSPLRVDTNPFAFLVSMMAGHHIARVQRDVSLPALGAAPHRIGGAGESEWVCVDSERRAHSKSDNGNHEGIKWYLAEYDCGSLPCGSGQFDDSMEVACAVCGIPDASDAVYTRWGHDSCPGGDDNLIYTGAVGGAQHGRAGGGYNALCLPLEPKAAPANKAGAQ